MGQIHDQITSIIGANGVTQAAVTARGSKGAIAVEILDASGNQITLGSGLVTAPFDYIALSNYDVNNNPGTITYKSGGAGGTTVATLTLAYSGANLTSVTKT
jgi:hypothetical protein